MSVETGSTISALQSNWPTGQDSLLEGDDHLRLLKAILKAQFPGAAGQGFAKAISAKEDEINFLAGVTSNIQTQLNALANKTDLIAPSGTKLTFFQATPPVGWTAQTGANDAMLRVVATGGGLTGGTASPISLSLSHRHTTQSHTLSVSEMPGHSHTQEATASTGVGNYDKLVGSVGASTTSNIASSVVGGGSPHSHGDTGSALSTWSPKYVNVIIAVKD